eukprot:2911969-Karenia_brevis.AAC.1
MWEIQVGAVQNPSIRCWVCGQMGHMGRNCPSKGKGKGAGGVGKGGGIPPPVFAGKGAKGVPGKGIPGFEGALGVVP